MPNWPTSSTATLTFQWDGGSTVQPWRVIDQWEGRAIRESLWLLGQGLTTTSTLPQKAN